MRYILFLIYLTSISIPVLAFTLPQETVGMCKRIRKHVTAGHYDFAGNWYEPYTTTTTIWKPCYEGGYVPPVGRPAQTESNTR